MIPPPLPLPNQRFTPNPISSPCVFLPKYGASLPKAFESLPKWSHSKTVSLCLQTSFQTRYSLLNPNIAPLVIHPVFHLLFYDRRHLITSAFLFSCPFALSTFNQGLCLAHELYFDFDVCRLSSKIHQCFNKAHYCMILYEFQKLSADIRFCFIEFNICNFQGLSRNI